MRNPRGGFTLVELSIVIAIIGVLAAIAIPRYTEMQLKSKRVELFVNTDGIKHAEEMYYATNDGYEPAPAIPATVPSREEVEWPTGSAGGFDTLGWEPDGLVRGQYTVNLIGENAFEIVSQSDCDGDGHYAEVRADNDTNPYLVVEDVY